MQPSSFVFVAIVALWAAYLLPQWIRRRDALGASRGSDRHSLALRVLERRRHRRRPGPSSTPLLPTAPAPAPPLPGPSLPGPSLPGPSLSGLSLPGPSVAPAVLPSPTRGARRRATVLAVLVASTLLTTAGAVAGVVPGALLLVPAGLLVADLAALRARSRRLALTAASAGAAVRRARPADARQRIAETVPPSPVPLEPPVPDAAETAAEELVSEPVDERTWVPVPVPPPTYTLKPMAPRPEPAPLEILVPAARPAASASGPVVPSVPAARGSRPWAGEPADVDLDTVLQRRRAVNG